MSPSIIASLHDDLERATRLVDRCMARVSVMAGFPDAGDEPACAIGEPHPPPEPPPPRPGWRPAGKH